MYMLYLCKIYTLLYFRTCIRFNPTICVCASQVRTWISNIISSCLFCVQWVKMRGDCSLGWYWQNCWPSLFKLSLLNPSVSFVVIRTFVKFGILLYNKRQRYMNGQSRMDYLETRKTLGTSHRMKTNKL